MVECSLQLDSIFSSLADPTRRDILRRVAYSELTVSQIAANYDMSLAAISKHLKIMEGSRLITKRRRGKQNFVRLSPKALSEATEYMEWYQQFMHDHLNSLEDYLNKEA
jgi:DNA-binding transcriptional ArsR family regulator